MDKPQTPVLTGVVGFFDQPGKLLEATRKVREAKYASFDTFTPYPVHGIDEAQGLKRSPLPFVTLLAGLTGGTLGFSLQYWTHAWDWPLIVGGKPYNSWPANIPITFETTVLLAALSTVGAMFVLNGLPNLNRRSMDPKLTQDRFAILIEAPTEADLEEGRVSGKKFEENEAKEFLKKLGAAEVRSVHDEGWFA